MFQFIITYAKTDGTREELPMPLPAIHTRLSAIRIADIYAGEGFPSITRVVVQEQYVSGGVWIERYDTGAEKNASDKLFQVGRHFVFPLWNVYRVTAVNQGERLVTFIGPVVPGMVLGEDDETTESMDDLWHVGIRFL